MQEMAFQGLYISKFSHETMPPGKNKTLRLCLKQHTQKTALWLYNVYVTPHSHQETIHAFVLNIANKTFSTSNTQTARAEAQKNCRCCRI